MLTSIELVLNICTITFHCTGRFLQIGFKNSETCLIFCREWYDNASCRNWYRRRPLEGAFTHPSKMVYPPGERYTPPPGPRGEREPRKPFAWQDQLPTRSPLNYEIGGFKSESQ